MLNVAVVKIVILFVKTKTRVRSAHGFRHIIMTDWRWGKRSNSSPSFLAAISRMRRISMSTERAQAWTVEENEKQLIMYGQI